MQINMCVCVHERYMSNALWQAQSDSPPKVLKTY